MNPPTPLPSRPLKWAAHLVRTVLWVVVGMWVVVGLAWGALHIFIVPRIGDWRADLETLATRSVGVPVRIGGIAVHTQGLVPSFELSGVRLLDTQGRDALVLDRVVTAVSLRSLWRLGFEQIHIDRPTLDVRRTTDGRLLVAGLDLMGPADPATPDNPGADWLFAQSELVLRGGTVHWTDDLRGQPTLTLSDVDLVVRNPGRQHLLRLDATPTGRLGDRFTLQAAFASPFLTRHPGRWREWSGTAHAQLPAVDMARLAVPAALTERFGLSVQRGVGALRLWVDVTDGQPTGGTLDLALSNVRARFASAQAPLALTHLQGRLNLALTADEATLTAEGLRLHTPQGGTWSPGPLKLRLTTHPDHVQGELQASQLALAPLQTLTNGLPLAPALHAHLVQLKPQGLLRKLKLRWQARDGTWPAFDAKGQVTDLALTPGATPEPEAQAQGNEPRPVPGRPGLAGANVDFDLNQDSGHAQVHMAGGWLAFPGVFKQPRIPVDSLSGDVRWQRQGDALHVQLPNLRFANADLQGQANVRWHTSDPDTSASGGRFPGVLDLEGELNQAKADRVYRYLPLVVGPVAHDYVQAAIVGGTARQVRFRVAGDLWQVPFERPQDGVLKVSAQLSGVNFAYVPPGFSLPGEPHWPALKQAAGELVFDRTRMTVRVNQAGLDQAPNLRVTRANAEIAHLLQQPTVVVDAHLEGPLAQALDVVRQSPLAGMTAQALTHTTASGNAAIRFGLTVPLEDTRRTLVNGTVSLGGNDVRLAPGSPVLGDAQGTVAFSHTGFEVRQAKAQLLGGELAFSGGMTAPPPNSGNAPSEAALRFAGQGTATALGLAQAPYLGLPPELLARASGSTAYRVELGFAHGLPQWSVRSTLQGLALDVPAPLTKRAEQDWDLHYQSTVSTAPTTTQAARETVQVRLSPTPTTRLGAQWLRRLDIGGAAFQQGVVWLQPSEVPPPPMPTRGMNAHLQLTELDADAWLATWQAPVEAQPTPDTTTPVRLPQQVHLSTDRLLLAGRPLHQLRLSARPTPDAGASSGWQAQVTAKELAGNLSYQTTHNRPPTTHTADTRDGQLVARLKYLHLNTPPDTPTLSAPSPRASTSLPALDVVVDTLRLDGRELGQLTLNATNRSPQASATGTEGAPREWLLHRLALAVPEAQLNASGTWAPAAAGGPRHTALQVALTVHDTGTLLGRFGMPGVFRGGKGQLMGNLAWDGMPSRLHVPSLSGQLRLDLAAGQFLKADPGLAKLLGVLSLQSLPRRLTLDFSDVFTQGFAFDFVRGDARIDRGVLYTQNLQMKGPNAAVLMDGQADIARETQHIRALVVPELNAGGASLLATLFNPAVGLGSLLAQALLRQPLMAASSQTFLIHGPWADPQVDKIPTLPTEPQTPATQSP